MQEPGHVPMSIEFKTADELEAGDETPGVVRKMAFQSEESVMVKSHVSGGTATSWHHHGERHVFGYLMEGRAAVEYGPGGRERLEVSAPGFFHVPPGVIHRDLNPDDDEQVSVVNFVGSGPVVVNTDEPE